MIHATTWLGPHGKSSQRTSPGAISTVIPERNLSAGSFHRFHHLGWRLLFHFFVLVVLFGQAQTNPAMGQQNRVGKVDKIEKPPTGANEYGRRELVRSVEVYRQSGQKDVAYKEMPLSFGDEINVGRGDPSVRRVIIGFDDPTLKILKLGPGSLVRLRDRDTVETESGLLAWFVGKLRATTKYVQAIAPGTEYGIIVDGERWRVFVWEGSVEVTNLGPNRVTVTVGEKQLTEAIGPARPSPARVPRFEEVKDLILFGLDLDPLISGSIRDHNLQQRAHEDLSRALFESRAQRAAVGPQINMGNANLFLGKYQQALAAFDRAEQISSRPSSIYNGRGIALTQLRQFDRAVNAFNRAISGDDESMFHNNLANLQLQKGETDAALDEYDRAVGRDQFNAAPYNGRGVAFIQRQELAPAEGAFQTSVRLNDRAVPHNNLGNVYLLQNKPAAAAAEYERALELDPGDAAALNNRGVNYLRQREFQRAVDAFNRSIQASPREVSPHMNLGLAHIGLGQIEEAVSALTEAMSVSPTDRTIYRNLAYLFLSREQSRPVIQTQLEETKAAAADDLRPSVERFARFLPTLVNLPVEDFEQQFEAFRIDSGPTDKPR